jgi:hypothetical protein
MTARCAIFLLERGVGSESIRVDAGPQCMNGRFRERRRTVVGRTTEIRHRPGIGQKPSFASGSIQVAELLMDAVLIP